MLVALLERFHAQKAFITDNIPVDRELGLIKVDLSKFQKLLRTHPDKQLLIIKNIMPKVIRERVADHHKWL